MKQSKATLLKITGLTNEMFETLKYEWTMWLIRLGCRLNPFKRMRIRKFASLEKIFLNIGCGPFGEDGWVNIDTAMLKNVSFTYDCRKNIPFRTNSVEVIRCEHVLEHMDKHYEATPFLRECLRVLKPNGVVPIVVPDIEKFIIAYYEKSWEKIGFKDAFSDQWSEADVLTHTFRQGGEHKFGYDYKALSNLLQLVGFETVVRKEYRDSMSPLLVNDQGNHKLYSLYVEGIKK